MVLRDARNNFVQFRSFFFELRGKRVFLGWDLVSARSRTFKFYHWETSSYGTILCTGFLYGSEGCVKKFRAISSIFAPIMGKKGFFRMGLENEKFCL